MQKPRSPAFSKLTPWLLAAPFAILVLNSLLSESADAHARHNAAYASVAALKSRLASPRTFRAEDVRVTDAGATCIQYRTRDGLGTLDREQAVVVGADVTQSNSPERFRRAWDRQCLGQSYDVTEAVNRFF